MFDKEIRAESACAATRIAPSGNSSRDCTVTFSVYVGRVLAVASLFAAPALVAPAYAAGLTISDPSNLCSWTFSGTTLTCNPVAPPAAGAPAGCSLQASPSTITAAQAVTLTAACSSGTDSNTTWAWSANQSGTGIQATTTGASSQVQSGVNVSATTTFNVTATNGIGSTTRSATVTLSTAGGGGGGGSGAGITCPGYSKTIVVPFSYVLNSGTTVKTTDGMSTTDIVVATFTTPGGTYAGGTPFIQITDNTPGSTGFKGSVSTTPCSFTRFKMDTQSTSWTYSVLPNTTYYVNITGDSPLSIKLTPR